MSLSQYCCLEMQASWCKMSASQSSCKCTGRSVFSKYAKQASKTCHFNIQLTVAHSSALPNWSAWLVAAHARNPFQSQCIVFFQSLWRWTKKSHRGRCMQTCNMSLSQYCCLEMQASWCKMSASQSSCKYTGRSVFSKYAKQASKTCHFNIQITVAHSSALPNWSAWLVAAHARNSFQSQCIVFFLSLWR